MRNSTAPSDPDAMGDWTYSETIDEESAAIRVHGRVDRLGVDLLRGTIEDLERRGHRDITVTLDDQTTIDLGARAVLAQIAGHLAGCHGRLRVTRMPGDGNGQDEPPGDDHTVGLPERRTAS
jgi:hypothetical protein